MKKLARDDFHGYGIMFSIGVTAIVTITSLWAVPFGVIDVMPEYSIAKGLVSLLFTLFVNLVCAVGLGLITFLVGVLITTKMGRYIYGRSGKC